jgi:hypothetical protein
MSPKPLDTWQFWQKSREALDALNDTIQIFATNLAQAEPLELPVHTVKEAKRALAKFQENFTLMVREQKRKAGR